MDSYLKFSGRDDAQSSLQYSNYGTGKTSPKGNARVTAEGGITTSRMFVREARERAQEEEMIQKLNTIE